VPSRPARAPSTLQLVRDAIKAGQIPPVARLVGFRLTRIARGSATIELDAGPRHRNPMGTLHGGIICDVADAAMGMAYASTLGADESFTTIELKVNFLRPVWAGHVVARGKMIRKGRTLGLLACRIVDDQGKLIAYATSTCLTLPGGPGSGLSRDQRSSATSKRTP
jgi:uncharacterized protein (TIGR00369 family)